uniref:DNA replication complex GINS family protein n=1 Tax=Geoglobus ahangari TaxID=113653 RepID=A0A7C3UJ80_9EURY
MIDELMIIVEKSRGALQKIDDNLFNQIKRRIKELEDMKKTLDDEDYLRIDEEIRTLRKLQKRLFELRTIKIIMQAWADVCETESGIEGVENMTSVERELYNKLVNLLKEYKKEILTEFSENIEIKGDKILVRVKQDIPEFEGIDGKTYKLRKGDVVIIPKLNADALIKSGVCEEIEVRR